MRARAANGVNNRLSQAAESEEAGAIGAETEEDAMPEGENPGKADDEVERDRKQRHHHHG